MQLTFNFNIYLLHLLFVPFKCVEFSNISLLINRDVRYTKVLRKQQQICFYQLSFTLRTVVWGFFCKLCFPSYLMYCDLQGKKTLKNGKTVIRANLIINLLSLAIQELLLYVHGR